MPAKLPDLDESQVRRMCAEGMTQAEMGAALGVHHLRVQKFCARHGIKPDPVKSKDRFRAKCVASARRWRKSDELVESEIRAMAESGMVDNEIAAAIGRSKGTVVNFRMAHGIPPAIRNVDLPFMTDGSDLERKMRHVARNVAGKSVRRGQRNAAYGLPEWTCWQQVKIIISLLDGPKTRGEVLAAIGSATMGVVRSRAGGSKVGERQCCMSNLIQNGAVVLMRKGSGSNKDFKYMLTMKTIDMLASAPGGDDE